MDNHEEKENALNKRPDSESESQNEDIPLWLQGMEESVPDETKPIGSKQDQSGSWIREIDENTPVSASEDEPDPIQSDDPTDHEYETEIDLSSFDDTQTDHQEDSIQVKEDFDAIDDLESTEEIEIQAVSENPILDEMEPDIDALSSVDGFVDISEVGMIEQHVEATDDLDDEPLREGDLPEWLQEMIAESEQEPVEHEPVFSEDSVIIHEPQDDDLINVEEKTPGEDIIPQDEVDSFDGISEPDTSFDYDITIAEDDTAPIAPSTDELQAVLSDEELPGTEDDFMINDEEPAFEDSPPADEDGLTDLESMPVEEEPIAEVDELSDEGLVSADVIESAAEPTVDDDSTAEEEEDLLADEKPTSVETNAFDRAKQFIDQGQIEPALPIINDMVEGGDQLEQLEVLLSELAENESSANSEVLEALGDVALKQNKPQDALLAYAKAIKLLLESEEVQDEID
jgi:hypothetical protein